MAARAVKKQKRLINVLCIPILFFGSFQVSDSACEKQAHLNQKSNNELLDYLYQVALEWERLSRDMRKDMPSDMDLFFPKGYEQEEANYQFGKSLQSTILSDGVSKPFIWTLIDDVLIKIKEICGVRNLYKEYDKAIEQANLIAPFYQ